MNVAVITGASMGLGEEFARQMAARKLNLVLVARSEDRLRALAEELQKRHGVQVVPFPCDLSKPGAAARVNEFLRENALHPTWLVNNAGFGAIGEFDSMDPQRITDMMMVNMVALVDLTRLLAPALRLGSDSRIINVASTAAFQPVPFFNVYSATKVFVLNFTDALHEEFRGSPVKVLALCPGPTPTQFAVNGGIDPAVFDKGQSARDVVRMGLEASDRNRAVLVCQRVLATILLRFVPRFVVRFAAGKVARSFMRRGAVRS